MALRVLIELGLTLLGKLKLHVWSLRSGTACIKHTVQTTQNELATKRGSHASVTPKAINAPAIEAK